MKKLAIVITLFSTGMLWVCRASAQAINTGGTALPRPADVLKVIDNSYNFGKIPQGRPATTSFEIVNTGNTPLKLDNVQASCGCTTPVWSHDPIAPGGTARIMVGYNAFATGPFTKTVTVVYNTNMTRTLTISGEVYGAPASSAPDNSSVQLLKQIN